MSALLDIGALAKRFDVGGKRLLFAVDEVSFTIGAAQRDGRPGGQIGLRQVHAGAPDQPACSIRASGSITGLGGTDLTAFKASAFAANPNRARIQTWCSRMPAISLNPRYTAADAIADPVRRLEEDVGRRSQAPGRGAGRHDRACRASFCRAFPTSCRAARRPGSASPVPSPSSPSF